MTARPKKAQKSTKSLKRFFVRKKQAVTTRYKNFLARRPYRTLRSTRRRDIPKYVPLPGYTSFLLSVFKTIKLFRKQLLTVVLVYVLATAVFVGIVNQDQYQSLTDAFKQLGPDITGGQFDSGLQALALFGAAITGGLNGSITEAQQLIGLFITTFMWLIIVWLLRQRFADVTVSVRDALYNAGAPLIPTLLVVVVGAIQLLPGAIGILVYTAAESAGALPGGATSMVFAVAAGLLGVLSLYWLTSTFFAAIIVTVPGTYPLAAIRMAGDAVIGRRVPIMLRIIYLAIVALLIWVVVLVPIIFLAGAINVSWLPLVPLTILLLSGFTVVFASTYIYMLYRRVLDAPAKR